MARSSRLKVLVLGCLSAGLLAACLTPQRAAEMTGNARIQDGGELMVWVEQTLAPYLVTQFHQNPSLKNKPFALVAMSGEDILPEISALAEDIRTLLVHYLRRTPGINMRWRPVQQPF